MFAQSKQDNSWQLENCEMIFDSTGLKAYPRWSAIGGIDKCVASVSDKNGNIMLYTNGCQVANRNHQLMPNGDSLNYNDRFYRDFWRNCDGGYPSRQSILILPDPKGNGNHYIIHLTVDIIIDSMAGTVDILYNRLNSSYVDMALDSGQGDVVEKNTPFFSGDMKSSHLTAINHANGQDWWIIKPSYEGGLYYRFLIDNNGISVDSQAIGPPFVYEAIINPNGNGESRFSPDGTKYALFTLVDGLQVYDFDRETGMLSNLKTLPWEPIDQFNIFSGIEFSPNSRFIYLVNQFELHQVDLAAPSLNDGLEKIADYVPGEIGNTFVHLSLAPDCKIYARSNSFTFKLHTIHSPNEKGQACDFRQSDFELPYFINLGSFPNVPRFRVDDEKPCCPTTKKLITTAPELEDVYCSEWYNTIRNFDERNCNPDSFAVIDLYRKGDIELLHTRRFFRDVGRGGFFDLNGHNVGRSETRDGEITFTPDSLLGYEFVRVLGDCNTGFPICGTIDRDNDGALIGDDCDDNDPTVNPGAEEICNQKDDNCDGQIDEGYILVRYYRDEDGDGYGVPSPSIIDCKIPEGYVDNFSDCDDTNSFINPGTTELVYNGIDDDCNPLTLDDDLDGDGFLLADDCDDHNAEINPDAIEKCDAVDNNCNGVVDEGLEIVIGYIDLDGDGYGSSSDSIISCALLQGYVDNNLDCDDSNNLVNPAAIEIPYNTLDDDCSHETPDDDLDQDGFLLEDDCDDNDPLINPNQTEEPYNGIDDDCDIATLDDDLDGDGYLIVDDCNDLDSLINPLAEEIPNNGIDEDCDGSDMTDSIEGVDPEEKILVYPNPTSDIIYIDFRKDLFLRSTLYDMNGVLLKTFYGHRKVDLTELENSLYILMIRNSNNKFIHVEKIVKY